MSNHTPGPWWTAAEWDPEERGCAIIAARTDCGPLPGNPTRGIVGFSMKIMPKDAKECEANARLIAAAAPDMLEALRDLLACVDDLAARTGWPDNNPRHAARTAIAKATGAA